MLIFVEGTHPVEPGMRRVEPGVGFLARRASARIVPVALWGTESAAIGGLLHRVRIRIRFGTAFDAAIGSGARDRDQALADEIARRIADLLLYGYRGVYGSGPALTEVPASRG